MNLQEVVQKIAAGIDSEDQSSFFDRLTRCLTEISGADMSVVSRITNGAMEAQSVSIFSRGRHLDNLSHTLINTPCQQTVERGFGVIVSGLKEQFDTRSFCMQIAPESYIGIRLQDRNEVTIGVIALLFKEPLENPEFLRNLLQIFATPAAMKLDRMREQVSREFLERKLNSILSIAREAIISVDEDSNIILFNEGAESIFGYRSEEVVGRSINLLLPEQLRNKHRTQMHNFRTSPEVSRLMTQRSGDIVALRKNGEIFPAEASITKASSEESTTITVVLRDITERQQSERALQSATRMQTLGNLAAGLAHDFNNILTLIRGSLDLLSSDTLNAVKTRHYMEVATKATDRGTELVSRLLAFGRPRTLEPEAVDPAELIRQLLDMLQVTLGEHIHVQFQKGKNNCRIYVDPSQLENAIVNLCFNARDAMQSGGTITLSLDCLHLEKPELIHELGLQQGGYARIKVQDDGAGMSKEIQSNALEPFYSTKLESGGTGLGLSMVLGFVKSAGGAVKIDSTLGHGTAIEIYLPVYHESYSATSDTESVSPTLNGTILIVEDQPDIRELAVHYAQSLGYKVLEAEDGIQALEILKNNNDIDLLFTDYQLPGGISGLDIANRMQGTHPEIKILISSGYGTQHVDLAKYSLLPKPYSLSTFAKYIHEVLNN